MADSTFEQLLNHLEHPFFSVPLVSFIENHCICFSPDLDDCEEYQKLHKEYAQLVTQLLDSFREDLKLSDAEIVKSLTAMHKSKKTLEKQNRAIEHVLAMEDYLLFVRLMQRCNLELQQQALTLIAMLKTNDESAYDDDNDPVLALVLQISKEEFEQKSKKEQDDLEETLRLSKEETEKLSELHKEDIQRLETETKKLVLAPIPSEAPPAVARAAARPPAAAERPPAAAERPPAAAERPPARHPPPAFGDSPSAAAQPGPEGSAAAQRMAQAFGNLTPDQLAAKQAFLREHRDKLMQIKQSEREKHLNAEMKTSGRERPASARTARSAMANQPAPAVNSEQEKKLAMRRAIAARLKEEVIDK